MTIRQLTVADNPSNEDLGKLIIELHNCIEHDRVATNTRIQRLEDRMDQNAEFAPKLFVTRAEVADQFETIKTALGIRDDKPPSPRSALAFLSRISGWHAFGMLGSIVIFLKIADSATPGLTTAFKAVWHAVIR